MSNSPSQRFARPLIARAGAASLLFPSPQTGSGAPRRRQPVALARRDQPRLRGVARTWRGAHASRRSTVAIFGRGPRFRLRNFLRNPSSELLAARSLCLAGWVPSLPSPPGTNRQPQDATPRSAFGASPETPLDERG